MNEVFTDENGRALDIGFGDKSLDYYDVQLNGIEREFFEVQNVEYYFPTYVWDGRPVMNRSYSQSEILDLLYDLESSSFTRETRDNKNIQTEINMPNQK